jgi:hypothetical protein
MAYMLYLDDYGDCILHFAASGGSTILSRPKNTKRGRDRPRLTWEEAIKRDLKE